VHEGDVVQRGQRIGMIKLGSTTELYLPADLQPKVAVSQGQKVYAGVTVLAMVTAKDQPEHDATPDQPAAVNQAKAPQKAPSSAV
jgi:hypothetical protein